MCNGGDKTHEITKHMTPRDVICDIMYVVIMYHVVIDKSNRIVDHSDGKNNPLLIIKTIHYQSPIL